MTPHIQSAQSITRIRQHSNLTNLSSAAIWPICAYCLSLVYLTTRSIAQVIQLRMIEREVNNELCVK
jgi:hypothetical protein